MQDSGRSTFFRRSCTYRILMALFTVYIMTTCILHPVSHLCFVEKRGVVVLTEVPPEDKEVPADEPSCSDRHNPGAD